MCPVQKIDPMDQLLRKVGVNIADLTQRAGDQDEEFSRLLLDDVLETLSTLLQTEFGVCYDVWSEVDKDTLHQMIFASQTRLILHLCNEWPAPASEQWLREEEDCVGLINYLAPMVGEVPQYSANDDGEASIVEHSGRVPLDLARGKGDNGVVGAIGLLFLTHRLEEKRERHCIAGTLECYKRQGLEVVENAMQDQLRCIPGAGFAIPFIPALALHSSSLNVEGCRELITGLSAPRHANIATFDARCEHIVAPLNRSLRTMITYNPYLSHVSLACSNPSLIAFIGATLLENLAALHELGGARSLPSPTHDLLLANDHRSRCERHEEMYKHLVYALAVWMCDGGDSDEALDLVDALEVLLSNGGESGEALNR